VYLKPLERVQAIGLNEALEAAKLKILNGERNSKVIVNLIKSNITQYPLAKIQYIACVNAQTLQPLKVLQGDVLIALAVYFGKTRLIDNTVVKINGSKKIKN